MKQFSHPETFFCPRCRRHSKHAEWRKVLRRVLAADNCPPARVLEHTTCKTMVYFLLE